MICILFGVHIHTLIRPGDTEALLVFSKVLCSATLHAAGACGYYRQNARNSADLHKFIMCPRSSQSRHPHISTAAISRSRSPLHTATTGGTVGRGW